MSAGTPPKKNAIYTFYVGLVSQADTKLLQNNPTLAAGDVKVSTDGGALANPATLPVVTPASSDAVKVTLSAAEMNGDDIVVIFSDAAGAEWADLLIHIKTSTRQIDNLAFPTTSGRSMGVETDGHVHTDLKQWLGVAPDALTGGKLATIGLIEVNTAQAATATTLTLEASATAYVGCWLFIMSASTGALQSAFITAWDDGTKIATVDTWGTTPTGTIVYALFASPLGASTGVRVGIVNNDALDGPAFAASAITKFWDEVLVELAQAIPAVAPSARAGLTLLYMALRNLVDVDNVLKFKEIHNDAGVVIAKKAITEGAGTYSEAKMQAGP